MIRSFFLVAGLAFAALLPGASADAAPPERVKKILIIGVDGMRVDALESRDPAAMFVYLRGIENIDADIGALVEAVRSRKNFGREDCLILLATDHGGIGTGHGGPRVARSFVDGKSLAGVAK